MGNRDLVFLFGQLVAAAGAANALDESVATQTTEQLFQIRKRDALTFADTGQRDRFVGLVHGEVEHRGDGKTAFGG